jgi:hypothetical protein
LHAWDLIACVGICRELEGLPFDCVWLHADCFPHQVESFGLAALTNDITSSAWPTAMRALELTTCMCIDADCYKEAHRREEERQEATRFKWTKAGARGRGERVGLVNSP